MASETVRLAQAIGEEGEWWSAGTWNRRVIERQLLSEVAVAVQRGNALAMLSGYTRALRASAVRGQRKENGRGHAVGGESEESGDEKPAGLPGSCKLSCLESSVATCVWLVVVRPRMAVLEPVLVYKQPPRCIPAM